MQNTQFIQLHQDLQNCIGACVQGMEKLENLPNASAETIEQAGIAKAKFNAGYVLGVEALQKADQTWLARQRDNGDQQQQQEQQGQQYQEFGPGQFNSTKLNYSRRRQSVLQS